MCIVCRIKSELRRLIRATPTLAPLPYRRALFAKRRHALLTVFGRERSNERRQSLRLRFARGEMRGPPRDGLDRANGKRRTREDIFEPAVDRRVQIGARDDLVDDTERKCFARRNTTASQQNAHRRSERDLSLKERHTTVERHAADTRLRKAEARLVARDDDVTAQHHLEATAECDAIDASNNRDIQRFTQRDAAESAGARRRPILQSSLVAGILHVGAGTECALAGAA